MSEIENLDQGKLESLATHANRARLLEESIETASVALQKMQEELRILIEGTMPEIMMEMNISEIKLVTGEKLIMTKFYSASITPEHADAAFDWLRKNNFDSLIKNKIEAAFGKGEDEKVRKLMEELAPLGFTCKTSVHPMTLKSFVREQVEQGTPPPADIFNLYIGNKIKIK